MDRGSLAADDRIDSLSLAVQFFTEAAAQDQNRVAANRDYEMFMSQIEMAADMTGASVDALALGLPSKSIGRSYGGSKRGVSCRRL